MEIDELPENDERLLKKAEIKRDEMGRFEQHGTGLIKKKQNNKSMSNPFVKGSRGGPVGARTLDPLMSQCFRGTLEG